ncbi:MAG TPA: hypothetical protein VEZ17_04265 [Chitinophagaceae bacterium]|jgi:hypothetical protein|nr:hypothetical protein [Chitinophagaceae bacterium]
MSTISDEFMNQQLTKTKEYTVVILKAGPNITQPGADKIIWEHGRRNFSLREQGKLSIVCPIMDQTEVAGVGIFDTDPQTVTSIMNGDPAIQQGVLVYEVHPCRSFPHDSLPA